MKAAAEAQVIETLIALGWSAPPSVYFEEQPRPDDLAEFLAVFVRPGRGAHLFVNQPAYRYAGLVVAQVFTKTETGTRRARALADSFAALWRTGGKPLATTGAAGTLRFGPSWISDIAERDDWLQLNVSVPYSRDVSL